MKVYKCIKTNSDELISIDDRFVKMDGYLIPYDSKEFLGLDMKFLDLERPERFNLFFEEVGSIPAKNVPFIKQKMEQLEHEITDYTLAIEEYKRELQELKDLE